MSDLPDEVRERLSDLLAAVATAARERQVETAREKLAAVRRVTEKEVPAGPLAERLHHGCDRIEELVAEEPLVAAEYAGAMRERVADGE